MDAITLTETVINAAGSYYNEVRSSIPSLKLKENCRSIEDPSGEKVINIDTANLKQFIFNMYEKYGDESEITSFIDSLNINGPNGVFIHSIGWLIAHNVIAKKSKSISLNSMSTMIIAAALLTKYEKSSDLWNELIAMSAIKPAKAPRAPKKVTEIAESKLESSEEEIDIDDLEIVI